MRLFIPDPWTPPGDPVEITVPDQQIADGFWRSRWAQDAGDDPTSALLAYLTASKAQGGLEASWHDRGSFRLTRNYVTEHNPEKGSS
jgi:hypothetical protein